MTIDASAPVAFPTDDPWLNGLFAPVADELDVGDLEVTGALPDRPARRLPAQRPEPGVRPHRPLPRVRRRRHDPRPHLRRRGRARYRNRWVDSRGRCRPSAGRATGPVRRPVGVRAAPTEAVTDEAGLTKNTANTHVVRHAGRILALMEGACPPSSRPSSSTVGEYDFGGRLEGAMTAHPKVDPGHRRDAVLRLQPVRRRSCASTWPTPPARSSAASTSTCPAR